MSSGGSQNIYGIVDLESFQRFYAENYNTTDGKAINDLQKKRGIN